MSNDPKQIQNEIPETREQRRARLASIRSRAAAMDYLTVLQKNPNLHYEWVNSDPLNVMRKQELGFTIVEDRVSPASHGRPDGKNIAGDVILMACPKDVKEDIDAIDRAEYIRKHGKKNELGEITGQAEEREFDSRVQDFSIIEESSTIPITGKELKQQLNKG